MGIHSELIQDLFNNMDGFYLDDDYNVKVLIGKPDKCKTMEGETFINFGDLFGYVNLDDSDNGELKSVMLLTLKEAQALIRQELDKRLNERKARRDEYRSRKGNGGDDERQAWIDYCNKCNSVSKTKYGCY
jgi:hypothetical protein